MIIRSNGEPTYFAADIGYVTEKFSRGFDDLIYIWGADHHGTVARVRNAAEAMGYDRNAVRMLLYSWVRFVRDGQEVSMSKRAGEFITLDELLAEVGVDAARWFFASRGATSAIDFDIELAKKQSNENPVYYVQYAHARIASIMRKAADSGLSPPPASTERSPVAPGVGPGARRGPVPRGRRGRRRRRGDAGDHGLRDRSGHDVPRASIATPAWWTSPSRNARRHASRLPLPRGSRWPTRCACSGSPRPNRCSRRVAGGRVRRRSRRRSTSSASRAASLEATSTATCVPAGDEIRAGFGQAGDRGVGGVGELGRVGRRVPRRVDDDAPCARWTVGHGQAVAAPARGRGRRRRRRHAGLAQPVARSGARRTCPRAAPTSRSRAARRDPPASATWIGASFGRVLRPGGGSARSTRASAGRGRRPRPAPAQLGAPGRTSSPVVYG